MGKSKLKPKSKLKLENINGFFEKRVTAYGTGAKVGCPKEYLGKKAYVVIVDE